MNEFSETTAQEQQNRIAEARARIMWGTPHREVLQWMLANGADPGRAEQEIKLFRAERRRTVRNQGIGQAVKGSVILVIGAVPMSWLHFIDYKDVKFLIIFGGIALYGIGKLVHGLDLTLTGRKKGAV